MTQTLNRAKDWLSPPTIIEKDTRTLLSSSFGAEAQSTGTTTYLQSSSASTGQGDPRHT